MNEMVESECNKCVPLSPVLHLTDAVLLELFIDSKVQSLELNFETQFSIFADLEDWGLLRVELGCIVCYFYNQ